MNVAERGPSPLRYELDRAHAAVTTALAHVDQAIPLATEPELGALRWLRADLSATAKKLSNISKIARG